MTSQEYAGLVAKTVRDAKDARTLYEDDHQMAHAYDELAEGAAKRCQGVGQMLYEVTPGVQRFELRGPAEAIIECRQEALDVPAYLTQVAHLMGLDADPDVREGIDHAAKLLVILDRLSARVESDG